MTDLYIETPTQADYDALIRLAENAEFEWASGNNMSEEPNNYLDEREKTVIHLDTHLHEMWYCNQGYYRDNTIEMIPNLAKIKAIWKVQPDDYKAFFKGKSYKHPLPSDESVIMLEMTDELTEGFMDIYKALAVEYKPQESEDMPEKVKLPKMIFDWLDNEIKQATMWLNVAQPFTTIAAILNEMNKKTFDSDLFWWINLPANQWKLIDALRYGYEPEPEPRWGIKAGNCYMDDPVDLSFTTRIDEACTSIKKRTAEDRVSMLGFGEVVDLNKED